MNFRQKMVPQLRTITWNMMTGLKLQMFQELDINLNGYYITDDLARPTRFQFSSSGNELVVPAHGYLILWADDDNSQGKKHLNFNISSKGGVIALFSPAGQLIDSVNYGQQYLNISYRKDARLLHMHGNIFQLPTPESANNSPAFKGVLDPPVPNVKPGFYNASIQLGLNPSRPGDSIFYATNNTIPTLSSFPYKDPLVLNQYQGYQCS